MEPAALIIKNMTVNKLLRKAAMFLQYIWLKRIEKLSIWLGTHNSHVFYSQNKKI